MTQSSVVVPDASVTKANVTDITEPGNTVSQAVVGETLTYTIGVMVPAHTSVYNGTLVDPLPTGVVFVGPATARFSATGTSPAGGQLPNLDATHTVTIDDTTGTLSFGTTYINDTDTDQLFEVTIPARIGTDPTNTHGTVRRNTATFTSDTAATGGTPITPRTASSNVTIVTPAPTLTKTVSPTSATGGDTVTYTLTASNASGRPPLHDTWVIDCLPGELGFGAFTTIPSGTSVGAVVAGDGSNGCASGYTRITWQINNLAGGASTTLAYTAVVNTVPAGGDQYTNTATLSGSHPQRRQDRPTRSEQPAGTGTDQHGHSHRERRRFGDHQDSSPVHPHHRSGRIVHDHRHSAEEHRVLRLRRARHVAHRHELCDRVLDDHLHECGLDLLQPGPPRYRADAKRLGGRLVDRRPRPVEPGTDNPDHLRRQDERRRRQHCRHQSHQHRTRRMEQEQWNRSRQRR